MLLLLEDFLHYVSVKMVAGVMGRGHRRSAGAKLVTPIQKKVIRYKLDLVRNLIRFKKTVIRFKLKLDPVQNKSDPVQNISDPVSNLIRFKTDPIQKKVS
jgi:hypothetical protein